MQEELQKKLFAVIDKYRTISGSKENEETLYIELEDINEKLIDKQDEKSELENTPAYYYNDDNSKLYDQTSQVQLRKKVQNLKKELKGKKLKLNSIKSKEVEIYESITSNNDLLVSIESVIPGLEKSLESLSNEESKAKITSNIENAKATSTEIKSKLEELNSEYSKVQEDLITASSEINELEKNIEDKENELKTISDRIANESSYVDQSKKDIDQKKIEQLNEEIKELETRRLEIIKEPVYLISESKKAVLENDTFQAYKYAKQLGEQLSSIPYVDIPKNALQDEINMAEAERDSFYAEKQGKNYTTNLTKSEQSRIDFLTHQNEAHNKDIAAIDEEIEQIENDLKYNTSVEIALLNNDINELNEKISKHSDVKDIKEAEEKAYVQALLDEKARCMNMLVLYYNEKAYEQKVVENKKSEKENLLNIIKNNNEEIIKHQSVINLNKDIVDIDAKEADLKHGEELVHKVKDLKAVAKIPYRLSEVNAELEEIIKNDANYVEKEVTEEPVIESKQEVIEEVTPTEEIAEIVEEPVVAEEIIEPVIAPTEEAQLQTEVSFQQAFADEQPAEVLEVQEQSTVTEVAEEPVKVETIETPVAETVEEIASTEENTETLETPAEIVTAPVFEIAEPVIEEVKAEVVESSTPEVLEVKDNIQTDGEINETLVQPNLDDTTLVNINDIQSELSKDAVIDLDQATPVEIDSIDEEILTRPDFEIPTPIIEGFENIDEINNDKLKVESTEEVETISQEKEYDNLATLFNAAPAEVSEEKPSNNQDNVIDLNYFFENFNVIENNEDKTLSKVA